MNHPLHRLVADVIQLHLCGRGELVRDPACGGNQQLPLFVGQRKARDTRMCCVDLLVLSSGQVRAIVEIEESGFLPTKICGKFFQAALASHFIHDKCPELAVPYAPQVMFMQVLDRSRWKQGTRKDMQARLIEGQIRMKLPVRGITDYHLLLVNGPDDSCGLASVGTAVSSAIT